MCLLLVLGVVRDFEVQILELTGPDASTEVQPSTDVRKDSNALPRHRDADDGDIDPDGEEVVVETLLFEDFEDGRKADAARDFDFAVRFEFDRRRRLEPRSDAQTERSPAVEDDATAFTGWRSGRGLAVLADGPIGSSDRDRALEQPLLICCGSGDIERTIIVRNADRARDPGNLRTRGAMRVHNPAVLAGFLLKADLHRAAGDAGDVVRQRQRAADRETLGLRIRDRETRLAHSGNRRLNGARSGKASLAERGGYSCGTNTFDFSGSADLEHTFAAERAVAIPDGDFGSVE